MAEAVKVIVRCRPLNTRETNLKCENIIEMDSSIGQCRLRKPKEKNQPPKSFTFDGVFFTDSITENLYADICFPLVEGCVEGYNGTVFAYGQTGCGKSFTMQGIEDPPTQRGIIPRAFEHIFESIQVSDNAKFLVHASYLEIYNEDIRDLISKDQKSKLEVKESPDKGVYVKDLLMVPCHSVKDMEKVMDKGAQNRSVGATLMNADSSRSHSIFTIFVETCETGPDGEEHIRAGKLNLVDLAGSERQAKTGATGDRLKEATKINLSLSALGNVISALVDGKSKHIPYRDSKLTRLLQDSLGGNTKTLMVACVSPADNNYEETLSTLRYANRAKNIKNKPKINEDPKDALLREYQDEIQMLKKLLTGQLEMSPELIAKLGITGTQSVLQPSSSPQSTNHQHIAQDNKEEVERETERIKKEYETKLAEMQKKFENEQSSKEKLAEDVAKLQEDLSKRLEKTSASLTGFKNDNAEAILAEFQAKIDSEQNETEEDANVKLETKTTVIVDDIRDGTDVTQISSSTKTARTSSPSLIRGVAAKGIGMIKDKLSGSGHNMSVSISKHGEKFTKADIRVSEEQEVKHISPKKILGSTVGNMAAHIQEEAVKRLTALQEQLVGSEETTDDKISKEKERLKEKHKKRKDHALERQRRMKKEVQKWEGEGIMVKVYDNLQEEIKAKNNRINELETEVTGSKADIGDLYSEFESERVDYLDTIRKLEKEVALQNDILTKIQPLIRRDCNYYSIDRMKLLSEYNEETGLWSIPELKMERTSLPKAAGSTGKGNVSPLKQHEATVHESAEDRYGSHLQQNVNEAYSNNYFKPKRADEILASTSPNKITNVTTNNNNGHLYPNSVNSLSSISPVSSLQEPMRRPQKLEALPVSAFEKKKKNKNKSKEM